MPDLDHSNGPAATPPRITEAPASAIARIKERIERTPAGTLCLALLILNAGLTFFGFIADSSAIRQAAYGSLLAGGSVLFGLGVLLGRKKTYIVTRDAGV